MSDAGREAARLQGQGRPQKTRLGQLCFLSRRWTAHLRRHVIIKPGESALPSSIWEDGELEAGFF